MSKIGEKGSVPTASNDPNGTYFLFGLLAAAAIVITVYKQMNAGPAKTLNINKGHITISHDEHKELRKAVICRDLPDFEGDVLKIPRRRQKEDEQWVYKCHLGTPLNALEIEKLFEYNYD